MKNVKELRSELADVFGKLKDGHIKPQQAGTLANIAGKMISSAKSQIEYYSLRGEKPNIKFLDSDD
jgi:hypothetical protein